MLGTIIQPAHIPTSSTEILNATFPIARKLLYLSPSAVERSQVRESWEGEAVNNWEMEGF